MRRIPRYPYIPSWGLADRLPAGDPAADHRAETESRMHFALRVAGVSLGASAVVHLIRYILLVVNRDTPLPQPLITASDWLVLFTGVLALLAFVGATWAVVGWVLDLRADAYERAGLLDPRRGVWVGALVATPLVNLVGAPLVFNEIAAARTMTEPSLDASLLRRRLTKLWVAWLLVNATAVVAVLARIVAWQSNSLQTGANALAMVVVSAAVSAAFAFWMSRRVRVLFDAAASAPVPTRRWVAVG